tara:strand:- start:1864 stop:2295 length:432 start_codon:yes stop_codon:yes gene_type:complete
MKEDQLNLFNINDYDLVFDLDPDDPNTKTCKICGTTKPLEQFPKHCHYADNLDVRCKTCIKEHTELRNYLKKISPPPPERCECCGEKSDKSLHLDHCHTTKEFRGWLCESCNTGLGKLGDNLEGVQKAVSYLKRVESKQKDAG